MSTLKANGISNGSSPVEFPSNLQVLGTGYVARPYTAQATPPVSPMVGHLWYNTQISTINLYTGSSWVSFTPIYASAAWYGTRGVFFGGINTVGTTVTTMDYITIGTTGNAASFGSLNTAASGQAAVSGGGRALAMGGALSGNSVNYSQTIVFATLANATVWPTTLMQIGSRAGGVSNGTYAVMAGGYAGGGNVTTAMQRTAIATATLATYVGNLVNTDKASSASMTNGTYGLFAGGNSTTSTSIDYMTITTDANAASFGVLATGHYAPFGCSNNTYGLTAGGYDGTVAINTIEYVTIATPGNATSFGNLTVARNAGSGTSDGSRGVFGGGTTTTSAPNSVNTIDYVTIATPGNATSFGTLTAARYQLSAASGT